MSTHLVKWHISRVWLDHHNWRIPCYVLLKLYLKNVKQVHLHLLEAATPAADSPALRDARTCTRHTWERLMFLFPEHVSILAGPSVSMGFPSGISSKESAYNAGDTGNMVWSLAWEDSLEKEMTTPSNILAWFPWTEEPGRLPYCRVAKSRTRLKQLSLQKST